VLMCADRSHGSGPYPVMTRAEMRAGLDLLPAWALEQKATATARSSPSCASGWLLGSRWLACTRSRGWPGWSAKPRSPRSWLRSGSGRRRTAQDNDRMGLGDSNSCSSVASLRGQGAVGRAVPSHWTWPSRTSLSCGGSDWLRCHSAARLTESGPRWPFSRRCLTESGPQRHSLGGVSFNLAHHGHSLGRPAAPTRQRVTQGAVGPQADNDRRSTPSSVSAARSGRARRATRPAQAAISESGSHSGSPPRSKPTAARTSPPAR
jgi:hypothetical protein